MMRLVNVSLKSFSTSICSYVAGDTYRQLWKCATGGLTYSKRHRKRKSFTPIHIEHIQFGREKVKWVGLNKAIPFLNQDKSDYESLVGKNEERKPIRTVNSVNSFLTPHNLTLNISGYTNKSMKGRNVGYPIEIPGDDEFSDYESSVILVKKQKIENKLEQMRAFRVIVVVGNKKGSIGIGQAIATKLLTAVEHARNDATQHLYHVPIYDGHTIIHPVAAKYNNTYIAMDPRPRGYGIIAQRTIADICRLAGIQNIYAKIDGCSRNPLSIVKAFLRAVYSFESHQELADRTGCIVAAIDLPNSSTLNYGLDNGYVKVLALPTTESVIEAEKRRKLNMDDEFFNNLSHYRGLHEPKDTSILFGDSARPFKPIFEGNAIENLIKEGE